MMIDILAHYISMYLLLVALAAWRALPLSVIAMAAGLCLRKRLAPKYHAILWSLVVLRALIPVSIGSSWSMHGAIDEAIAPIFDDNSPSKDLSAKMIQEVHSNDRTYYFEFTPKDQQPVPKRIAQTPTIDWFEVIKTLLAVSIIVVTLVMILRGVIAHIHFAYRLRKCHEIEAPNLILLLNRECKAMGISRFPRLKEVPELSTPAMFGLLSSTICFPVDFIQSVSPQELRWIVRHELAHIRRHDTWVMTIASLAKSFHWLNPLTWLTTARLRSNIEAAADQLAIGSTSSAESTAYGHLLIRMAQNSTISLRSPALGLLPFASSGQLKSRIERLASNCQPDRKSIAWMFAVGLAFIVVLAFTDKASLSKASIVSDYFEVHQAKDARHLSNFDVSMGSTGELHSDSQLQRYDVTEVLNKFSQSLSIVDLQEQFLALCRGMFPSRELFMHDFLLFADLTSDQHAALVRVLNAWKQCGPKQVSVELQIIKTNLPLASKIDWLSHRIDDFENQGSQPILAAKISDAEMRSFIRDVQTDIKSDVTFAPKVTLFNGQTVAVHDARKIAYVSGTKPVIGTDAATWQPIVDEKDIGMKASFSPTVLENGSVDLMFDIQSTIVVEELLANLPFRATEGSSIYYPVVQVPTFSTFSIKHSLELAPAQTILIAVPDVYKTQSSSSEKLTIYAITPRILDIQ